MTVETRRVNNKWQNGRRLPDGIRLANRRHISKRQVKEGLLTWLSLKCLRADSNIGETGWMETGKEAWRLVIRGGKPCWKARHGRLFDWCTVNSEGWPRRGEAGVYSNEVNGVALCARWRQSPFEWHSCERRMHRRANTAQKGIPSWVLSFYQSDRAEVKRIAQSYFGPDSDGLCNEFV